MDAKGLFLLIGTMILQIVFINPVHADPKIKYGEWEINITVEGLPIAVPAQTQRVCLTKDHVVPATRQEQGCKMKWTLNKNTVNWTMKCNNGGNGKGSATYDWDKMHGSSEINVPNAKMKMRSKLSGKWVAATCSAQTRH
jgi:hypothetical protein